MMNYNPYMNYLNTINNSNNIGSNYNVQPTTLTRVTGLEGAKAYQMPANSTVALFDNNEDVMYIKTTDGAGFPTIRAFSFSEINTQSQTSQNIDYVTRDEFNQLKEELLNGKQSIQQSADLDTARVKQSNIKQNNTNEKYAKNS